MIIATTGGGQVELDEVMETLADLHAIAPPGTGPRIAAQNILMAHGYRYNFGTRRVDGKDYTGFTKERPR